MKVMMAIRMRGMCLPPMLRANTSLGLGHGRVVDVRAVMYESRKQLKMKVSLRRKIHIMAFPHETFLNARWSEDQSAAMPRQPEGCVGATPVFASAASAICSLPSSDQQLAAEDGELAHPWRQESE